MVDPNTVDPGGLAAQGWERRTVACEPRLSEALQTYQSLGYEVRLVPVLRECDAGGGTAPCNACFAADANPERFQVIYTRRKADGAEAPP